ncbi:MAG: cob(I)yrinic acid a,c-diamide adenosyltransferase [Firmicutes bacterium]|nr:cob(I)yrinic acid a,c-diamide adenosyltransferase [Bacillota bacterium]
MRIYTRTGDDGDTSLWRESGSPRRVSKDDARVEAYGAVDEANSALGLAKALLEAGMEGERALIDGVQRDLFALGAELATPDLTPAGWRLRDEDVRRLEGEIDRLDAGLPRLRSFVLPDGSPAGAALHLARATVRRAERACVHLARTVGGREGLNPAGLRYLNRLSDLLFVLARHMNARAGVTETPVAPRPPGGAGA